MTKIPDDVMKAAQAILNAIDSEEVYIGETTDFRSVMIDGHVDLTKIATAAIMAERERCEKVADKWAGDAVQSPEVRLVAAYIRQGIQGAGK